MKNYFESENCIVPFEKVVSVSVVGTELYVYLVQHNIPKDLMQWYEFPIDQLANYKLWLESQSNSQGILTSCSGKANDSFDINRIMYDEAKIWAELERKYFTEKEKRKANDSVLQMIKQMQVKKKENGIEIPETKWLIGCWDAVYGRKIEELNISNETKDFIEEFLHDCLEILDYAGALNNKNKGDVNDLVLTREQVTRILRRIGDCTICKAYQRIGKFEDALVPCKKCEVYSNLNPLDEIVEEINELIKEK